MFVIQVTPLIKATQLESLSYFSSIEYPLGTFLQIPVRGKQQLGIVTDSKTVSSTKTALKAATFSLRKLPVQENAPIIPRSLLKTAEILGKKYPASAGAILHHLLPTDVRNGLRPYPSVESHEQEEDSMPQLLTAQIKDRLLHYQTHIRSTFAHRGSVLLVVPTSADIDYIVKNVSTGIDDRVIILSSTQTRRQRDKAYEKIEDLSMTKLIVTTPPFAYIERIDLMSIIIEQCASNHYRMRTRPYLDHRDALIAYAASTGRNITLGDTVPRTEDEVSRREEHFLTAGETVKRLAFPSPLSIVKQKDKSMPDKPFQLFSDELINSATHALAGRGHVFLYGARRGLAPVVTCIDCGHIFRCPDSGTPYSLLRTKTGEEEERWFVSSTSGKKIRAEDLCPHCGSWRLRERGIGIQQMQDEWTEKMPKSNVFIMDHQTANTPRKAAKIAAEFFAQKSAVLIGTQVALPYLNPGVDVSAIVSLDAARSVPTWRADESVFRLLMRLREITEKEVLVQTRTGTDNLLTFATRGSLERFYDDEISLRQMVNYPPYTDFVLLTWVGSKTVSINTAKLVRSALKDYADLVQLYNSPNSTPTKTLSHALIRISTVDTKIYEDVLQKVRRLPPYIKIEINPERIV